jgi:hypothetical protein
MGKDIDQARWELLWLVARRLYRDHTHRADGTECATCHQPWPCSGRRLAELGLTRAAGGLPADELSARAQFAARRPMRVAHG